MWVRGLKLSVDSVVSTLVVAPYVGAWIETLFSFGVFKVCLSHPMWVRGLKLYMLMGVKKQLRGRTLCGCVD